MTEETKQARSTHRRRRVVAKASISYLSTHLKDLEADLGHHTTIDRTRKMARKLDTLDSDFRAHHQNVIDLVNS